MITKKQLHEAIKSIIVEMRINKPVMKSTPPEFYYRAIDDLCNYNEANDGYRDLWGDDVDQLYDLVWDNDIRPYIFPEVGMIEYGIYRLFNDNFWSTSLGLWLVARVQYILGQYMVDHEMPPGLESEIFLNNIDENREKTKYKPIKFIKQAEDYKNNLQEMRINKPNQRKLKVKVTKRDDGYVYFKFYLDNNESEETSMLLTNFSLDKNYAEVYLNEDDIYADRLHEDVIYYLNSNRIPFTVYDDEEEDYIDGKNFEIPDHPDDMLGKYILINKKDCDVPREYQRAFDNL